MSDVDRITEILRNIPSPIAAEQFEPGFWRSCASWEQIIGKVAPLICAALHPRIETVEQLDALPDHSIIRCASGAAWHKQELYCSPGEPWWCAGSEIESPATAIMLPARVLYMPEVDQ